MKKKYIYIYIFFGRISKRVRKALKLLKKLLTFFYLIVLVLHEENYPKRKLYFHCHSRKFFPPKIKIFEAFVKVLPAKFNSKIENSQKLNREITRFFKLAKVSTLKVGTSSDFNNSTFFIVDHFF